MIICRAVIPVFITAYFLFCKRKLSSESPNRYIVGKKKSVAGNHIYVIAPHFVFYKFAKIHKTLRVTHAMEAKLSKKPMSIEDIVRLGGNYIRVGTNTLFSMK